MLKALFALLFVYVFVQLLLGIVKRDRVLGAQSPSWPVFVVLIIIWIVYLTFLSNLGVLEDFSLPPRLVVWVILPAFLIICVFFLRANSVSYLRSIPRSWPIAFQSFRIFVELLIWKCFLVGLLPDYVTFEKYNFEIVVGITALPLAFLCAKGMLTKAAIGVWNVWGLLMLAIIVGLLMTSGYASGFWGAKASLVSAEFLALPYLLIPGFFMPVAVFMHVFSLLQLRLEEDSGPAEAPA